MAEGVVGLAPDALGKKVRTQELSVSGNTVEQQVVTAADAAGNLVTASQPGVSGKVALDVNVLGASSGIAAVTGTIVATNGTVQVPTDSAGNVTVSVKGTYSATLIFEASDDGGTTWYPVQASRADGTGIDVTTAALVNASVLWELVGAGFTHVRVRASVYTSGTVSVRLTAGPMLYDPSPIVQVAGQSWGQAGRTRVSLVAVAVTPVATTETLLSLTPSLAGVASGAVTTWAVPTGKTFRLQSLNVTTRMTAAAIAWTRFTLRCNPSGAATAASPQEFVTECAPPAAVIGAVGQIDVALPDGCEFTAGQQIAVSYNASVTGQALTVAVNGFLY